MVLAPRLLELVEGGSRLLVGKARVSVTRAKFVIVRPGIEIGELPGRLEQEHLLVLTVHLDGGGDCGELAHRRHGAVNRAAATPARAQAPAHDVFVIVYEACLGKCLVGPVSHDRIVRTGTAYEPEGGQKRRLSRARLAREHGEARCEGNRGVFDEGDV